MLFETDYNYAGFEINAATDDQKNLWISLPTISNILGLERFRYDEFFARKSTKGILGADFNVVVISSNTDKSRTKKTFVSIGNFLAIMAIYSGRSEKANAFVTAGFSCDFTASLMSHLGEVLNKEQREYPQTLAVRRSSIRL